MPSLPTPPLTNPPTFSLNLLNHFSPRGQCWPINGLKTLLNEKSGSSGSGFGEGPPE